MSKAQSNIKTNKKETVKEIEVKKVETSKKEKVMKIAKRIC